MAENLERFDPLSSRDPGSDNERLYVPYPVAIETGRLTDADSKAKPAQIPPGVNLANGVIPNAEGAGLIDTGGNEIVAFDLVDIQDIESDEVLIEPISKLNVTKEGKIVGEGKVVAQYRGGLLRIVARAINVRRHPHEADRLSLGNPNRRRLAGEIAVFNEPVLGVVDEREITDLNLENGSMVAKRRRRYW